MRPRYIAWSRSGSQPGVVCGPKGLPRMHSAPSMHSSHPLARAMRVMCHVVPECLPPPSRACPSPSLPRLPVRHPIGAPSTHAPPPLAPRSPVAATPHPRHQRADALQTGLRGSYRSTSRRGTVPAGCTSARAACCLSTTCATRACTPRARLSCSAYPATGTARWSGNTPRSSAWGLTRRRGARSTPSRAPSAPLTASSPSPPVSRVFLSLPRTGDRHALRPKPASMQPHLLSAAGAARPTPLLCRSPCMHRFTRPAPLPLAGSRRQGARYVTTAVAMHEGSPPHARCSVRHACVAHHHACTWCAAA